MSSSAASSSAASSSTGVFQEIMSPDKFKKYTSAECVKIQEKSGRKEADLYLKGALENIKAHVAFHDKKDDTLKFWRKRVYAAAKKACAEAQDFKIAEVERVTEAQDFKIAEVERVNKGLEKKIIGLESDKVRRNGVIRKQGTVNRHLQSVIRTQGTVNRTVTDANKALKKQVTAAGVQNYNLIRKLRATNAELVTTKDEAMATITGLKRDFGEVSATFNRIASQHRTHDTSPLSNKRMCSANISSMTASQTPTVTVASKSPKSSKASN